MTQLDKHTAWKAALHFVALRSIERGEWDDVLKYRRGDPVQEWEIAGHIAHRAASDMVMAGRTIGLPMDEVEAANPFPESSDWRPEKSERRLSGERGGNARAKAGVHSQIARVRHAAGSRSSDGSDTLLPNPNTVKPERVRA